MIRHIYGRSLIFDRMYLSAHKMIMGCSNQLNCVFFFNVCYSQKSCQIWGFCHIGKWSSWQSHNWGLVYSTMTKILRLVLVWHVEKPRRVTSPDFLPKFNEFSRILVILEGILWLPSKFHKFLRNLVIILKGIWHLRAFGTNRWRIPSERTSENLKELRYSRAVQWPPIYPYSSPQTAKMSGAKVRVNSGDVTLHGNLWSAGWQPVKSRVSHHETTMKRGVSRGKLRAIAQHWSIVDPLNFQEQLLTDIATPRE